jgi:hypothetical protein
LGICLRRSLLYSGVAGAAGVPGIGVAVATHAMDPMATSSSVDKEEVSAFASGALRDFEFLSLRLVF